MLPAIFFKSSLAAPAGVDVFANNAYWYADPTNPWVYFESSMIVPPLPPANWKTLFIWPGLQPGNGVANFKPIDNGVLQPVLTYGSSCAPNGNGVSESGWWISAQYVNTVGSASGYTGCNGGERMAIRQGDSLKMVMSLRSGTTIWDQTVTSQSTGRSVRFSIDMRGQGQSWAEFVMEIPGGWHQQVPRWTVSNIILKTAPNTLAKCRADSKVQQNLPGNSLACADPVIQGNSCTINSCKFNGGESVGKESSSNQSNDVKGNKPDNLPSSEPVTSNSEQQQAIGPSAVQSAIPPPATVQLGSAARSGSSRTFSFTFFSIQDLISKMRSFLYKN